MAVFRFKGSMGTLIVFTGGTAICEGGGQTKQEFSGTAMKGVGLSIHNFGFEVECACPALMPGDSVTISSATLLFAAKVTIHYRLCGGACTGTITQWRPGLGLGLSGALTFVFN